MATATLTVTGHASKAGIEQMKAEIDKIEAEFFGGSALAQPTAGAGHDVVKLYETIAPDSRSREALELLPGGKANAITPEELAQQMVPDAGKPVSRASARAAIRVVQRVSKKLLGQGVLQDEVVRIDWDRYKTEKAGRYYLDVQARKALDKHLKTAP